MKEIKMTGFLLMLILFSSRLLAQSDSPEQLAIPLSRPGKPFTLNVHLIAGSVKVVSYAGKEIVIDVTGNENNNKKTQFFDHGKGKKVQFFDQGKGRVIKSFDQKFSDSGMKRISSAGSYELTAKENDNIVTVNTGRQNRAFHLSLKIPQDVKLKVGTVNNGNIEINNVKGELEINSVNGGITLTNISGSVVANTVNGNIITSFVDVDPKAPMAFSTLNGNISVTLPPATKANLRLKSDKGDIYSDFDIDIDKIQPKSNKTYESGLFKIKMEAWVNGKINGGGPEMLMKNMRGNIYVKKAK